MATNQTVRVPERGSTRIQPATWTQLSQSDQFWLAVDEKLFAVDAAAGGAAVLRGSMYVGSVVCGQVRIDLVEKLPGVVDALLSHATPRARSGHGAVGQGENWIDRVVDLFLSLIEIYTSAGREWAYSTATSVSPTMRGRLLVPQTMRLWARGARHLIASQQVNIDRRTALNALIAVTLSEVDSLRDRGVVHDDHASRARGLGLFYQDSLDWVSRVETRSVWLERARDMAGDLESIRGEIAALASAILGSQSHAFRDLDAQLTSTWVLNLEIEFERAIRRAIGSELGPSYKSFKPTQPYTLFDDDLRLVPDIVTVHRSSQEISIGDAKYKVWSGGYQASDIYQLVTHAAVGRAEFAYLVYPAERFERRDLGESRLGVTVSLFGVDLLNIRDGALEIARAIKARGADVTA